MKNSSFKSLLKNREFILMQFGMSISRVGTFMQDVAVNWQLYQMTKSPLALGILGLSKFIPIFFGAFFSGIIADIYNRKKIIFVVQIFAILTAFALFYLTATNQLTPFLIYLLVGFDALFYSFEAPARQAMGPTIIPRKDFPLAVNIMNIIYQSTLFIGPAIAGFIIAFYGVKTTYLINAISFVAVLVSLVLMKPLPQIISKPKFNFLGVKEGFAFVFKNPLIRGSMFIDFFATFFGSASTMMPIFAVDILKVGPTAMGFLYAAPSIGAIFAGLIFPFLSHIKSRGKLLIGSIIFYGLNMFLFSLSKNFYLSLFFIALSGAGDMISVIVRNVIRQLNTPDHIRGRMTAINMAFYTGGPQLGEVEAGFVANYISAPVSVAIGGLATIIATLYIAYTTPELTNYKDLD